MELGIISSIWFDTPVGRLEGIQQGEGDRVRHLRHLRGPARHHRRRARRDQAGVRGGRAPDPLRRLRGVRHRRLQPVGAPLHARPDQGLRRPGRLPRRAQRAARRRRVLLGRRGLPAPGDLGHGEGHGQGGRRVRALEGPRDRARARAVQRGAAQGRPRARALRQGDRPSGRARERRHLPPPPLGLLVRRGRGDDRADRPHPPLRLRRQGARRHAGRHGRDADQGVPRRRSATPATTARSRSSSSTRRTRTRSSPGPRRPTTARPRSCASSASARRGRRWQPST